MIGETNAKLNVEIEDLKESSTKLLSMRHMEEENAIIVMARLLTKSNVQVNAIMDKDLDNKVNSSKCLEDNAVVRYQEIICPCFCRVT